MPDKDAGTPRVFIARHGETEWTKSGQYTGITELELTAHGVTQVQNSGRVLVGPGKLIDPSRIAHVYVNHMHGEPGPADIVLVAHGHLLRAFVKRWLGYPMEFPLSLMLEPGGIGVL
ncbi:hypothetical protein F66182_15881, partial [Fusarium sp. NRRL 66182]